MDNRAFLWSDMLHYRKTSQFGQKLWEIADRLDQADPNVKIQADRLRAYALGYITHLATDVTGHPFTNEKSGGPFRTHWQRHKLVENHMDARVYEREHGVDVQWSELAGSALHYQIVFNSDGGGSPRPNLPQNRPTIRNLYERRQALDIKSGLPIEVATLLYDAMGSAYVAGAQSNHPTESTPNILAGDGRPSPDAIQDTYGLFFRYMKHTVMDGYWHEKPMPPELFPNLDFPLLTAPGEEAPGEADEELDFLDWLLAIVRFCLFIQAVVVWILTLSRAVILDTATFGPRNVIYYGIDLPVYYMTLACRRILVMTGYLLPRREEIAIDLTRLGTGPRDLFLGALEAMSDTLTHLTDIDMARLGEEAGRVANELNREPLAVLAEKLGEMDASRQKPTEPTPDHKYPRRHEDFEHLHPWQYPQTEGEVRSTTAGPFERTDDATLLVEQTMSGEARIRGTY